MLGFAIALPSLRFTAVYENLANSFRDQLKTGQSVKSTTGTIVKFPRFANIETLKMSRLKLVAKILRMI